MTVDLSLYLNKEIIATLRNGGAVQGKLTKSISSISHPYTLKRNTYRANGHYWSQDETSIHDIVTVRLAGGTTKYQDLERQVAEMQAEIKRLKAEEEAAKPKLPERFKRQYALKLLDGLISNVNIDGFCIWSSTPQGQAYWRRLANSDSKTLPEDAIRYIQQMVILSYRQEKGE